MRVQAPPHKALCAIHDDHDRLGAVLHGMLFLLHTIRDGGAPSDLKVFHAMLFSLTVHIAPLPTGPGLAPSEQARGMERSA